MCTQRKDDRERKGSDAVQRQNQPKKPPDPWWMRPNGFRSIMRGAGVPA